MPLLLIYADLPYLTCNCENTVVGWIDWLRNRYCGEVTFLTYKRRVHYQKKIVVVHLNVDTLLTLEKGSFYIFSFVEARTPGDWSNVSVTDTIH